jgi:hypothetical protein
VIAPPTNSVARDGPLTGSTRSSPRTVWRPVRVTSPAKKVWMSPVTKVTSSIASAAMWSTSSWRSAP